MIKINKAVFFAALFLFSCISERQALDPKVYYKRDFSITFEKNVYTGVAVLPLRSSYDLKLKSKGDLDLWTFTTCHRSVDQEDAGGFLNSKEVKYTYTPNPPMETTKACPVQVGGYDIKGAHSWGYIDIETPDAVLPAHVKCGGLEYDSKGVTICQTKDTLVQEISFQVEVDFMPQFATTDFCKNIIYETKDNKSFRFEMPRRECVYVFIEKTGERKMHRLNTIGYEDILIRK